MASVINSPADVANLALTRMGFKGSIGSLYDGTLAANKTLDIYSATRDEILRKYDWGFAERNVVMTLLKFAPPGGYVPGFTPWTNAYPPVPWLYEYAYPDDCLKVRAIKYAPIFLPDMDPQPQLFSVENDNGYASPRKVILCNVPDALLVYSGQVVDPLTWEPDFVDAFAALLAQRLAPVLVGGEAAKMEAADSQVETSQAVMVQG